MNRLKVKRGRMGGRGSERGVADQLDRKLVKGTIDWSKRKENH